MLGYLETFSDSFIIAVALWPFLSVVLTLPILALMYHRHHRLRIKSVLTAYICVLYALGLAAFTLYPMPDDPASYCLTHSLKPQLHVMRFLHDISTDGKIAVLQLLFNVLLFMPLGFALKRWARWSAVLVLPAGFVASAFIEVSQLTGVWGVYPCAYRQFDVDDLITNTLGAVLGCLVAWAYGLVFPSENSIDPHEVNMRPGLLHRVVALVIDLIFVWVCDFALTFGFIAWFHHIATPTLDGRFMLLGHTFAAGVFDVVARLGSVLAFFVFELLIPVLCHGQTLGAMFTHMNVEMRVRQGGRRALFYLLRWLMLFAATQLFVTPWARVGVVVVLILCVFYVVARRMPYDFV